MSLNHKDYSKSRKIKLDITNSEYVPEIWCKTTMHSCIKQLIFLTLSVYSKIGNYSDLKRLNVAFQG